MATSQFKDYFLTTKLYDELIFTDCKIISSDQVEFKLHRSILAVKSDYFKTLMQTDMKEVATGIINLPEKAIILQGLFEFMYCGIIYDADEEMDYQELFIAADKYLLDDLKDYCLRQIKRDLRIENAVEYLMFANSSCQVLKEGFLSYIGDYFENVKNSKGWKLIQEAKYADLRDSMIDAFIQKTKQKVPRKKFHHYNSAWLAESESDTE